MSPLLTIETKGVERAQLSQYLLGSVLTSAYGRGVMADDERQRDSAGTLVPNIPSVMEVLSQSNSLRPHGPQPTRLPCPWSSPGKNSRVGGHFLLQGIFLMQGLDLRLLCLLDWQVGSLPLLLAHSLSHVQLFVTPWTAARQASLSFTISWFAQIHVHCIGDATLPSHPLTPSSPSALNLSQYQGFFQ